MLCQCVCELTDQEDVKIALHKRWHCNLGTGCDTVLAGVRVCHNNFYDLLNYGVHGLTAAGEIAMVAPS